MINAVSSQRSRRTTAVTVAADDMTECAADDSGRGRGG